MARTRPGLQTAVNEILLRHGTQGKRMSYRQAERLTGLSPATIGELAKGNARTAELVRRFATGLNEDVERLMLLAGFLPEDSASLSNGTESQPASDPICLDAETASVLKRLGEALSRVPEGNERDLWRIRLRNDIALLEVFARHYDVAP